MIETKIVCDSLAGSGVRLTTFNVTYPRFIHSELMTHRAFSRNASSSRAIPVRKQIDMIKDCPAIPNKFYKNQKGMQGTILLEGAEAEQAKALWLKGRDLALGVAEEMLILDIHKQHVNRILEPYSHITVTITATDFANFFHLRDHEAAEPNIQELARSMFSNYKASSPQFLGDGQWHLPFVTQEVQDDTWSHQMGCAQLGLDTSWNEDGKALIKRSAAMCARTSYLTHEGKATTVDADLALYDRLVGSSPLHASPTEHQAMACSDPNVRSGNLRGWIQFRQGLVGQNVTEFKKEQHE